jgi:CDP-glucose 4,6-dehydratase
VWGYRESDRLGGNDPYSSSKASAELAIHSYVNSYFSKEKSKVRIVSARAGNVIGGGDHNKNRLVPDLVESIIRNNFIKLRYPTAVRPWQHVLDCLMGYLKLTEKLSKGEFGEVWNFGPNLEDIRTVEEFTKEFYTIKKRFDFGERKIFKILSLIIGLIFGQQLRLVSTNNFKKKYYSLIVAVPKFSGNTTGSICFIFYILELT